MKKLWNKFTAWLSGWPEGTRQGKKIKGDEALFKEEKAKLKPKVKPKKIKGLNPKKKKRKNMT